MQPQAAVERLQSLELSERAVLAAVAGLAELQKQLKFLVAEEPGRSGLKKEVLPMRVVAEFKAWLLALLDEFLARCKAHLGQVLAGAELLTRDSPPVCADLLRSLVDVPDFLAFWLLGLPCCWISA